MGKKIVWDLEACIETVQIGKHQRVNGPNSYIFSIQWSYLDSDKVYSKAIYECKSFKKAYDNDKELCEFILELLSAPDVDGWITQNGSGFDIPLVNTRCLIHGLPPLPLMDHADTLKMARSGKGRLLLPSYSLDYMTKTFGLSAKDKVDYKIWRQAKAGDIPSLKRIVAYGVKDIPATKDLYKLLSKTHAKGFVERWDGKHCLRCNKTKFQSRGSYLVGVSSTKERYSCCACGKWHSKKV